jgi:DNA-directed RNA polymerase subunit F
MEARYTEKIKMCKTEDELYEYLLDTVSVLREYLDEDPGEPSVQTKNVVGLKIKSKTGTRRKDIFKKYMAEVEQVHDDLYYKHNTPEMRPCKNCKASCSFILDECVADMICKECGYTEYYQTEEVGFKEEQDMEKNIVYSYKRENHFNEWVSQFQAKESTTVPEEVISLLRNEFKKQKIKDLSDITHEKVKALLKKLDKSKYYEHVPYITTIINGIEPPTMPQPLEDKLRLMFHQIQKPFEKHKPEKRKNFLSYSDVLYKFCELLGEDDYLPCFPLLKSKEKLYAQDEIWKKICEELKWEYIKTV